MGMETNTEYENEHKTWKKWNIEMNIEHGTWKST